MRPSWTRFVLAAGILAVSAASIFVRLAQREADSLVIAAGRLVLASVVLAPLALGEGPPPLRAAGAVVVLAGVFLAARTAPPGIAPAEQTLAGGCRDFARSVRRTPLVARHVRRGRTCVKATADRSAAGRVPRAHAPLQSLGPRERMRHGFGAVEVRPHAQRIASQPLHACAHRLEERRRCHDANDVARAHDGRDRRAEARSRPRPSRDHAFVPARRDGSRRVHERARSGTPDARGARMRRPAPALSVRTRCRRG